MTISGATGNEIRPKIAHWKANIEEEHDGTTKY
jgi:hypothetical protein